MPDSADKQRASAGHKLGQLVGDWFEAHFVLPMLQDVAARLKLYLDHRFRTRPARGEKIVWHDEEGNGVDYDFVMELDGTDDALGVPVAFLESFWRRGARHSKDKARDDSGKLSPMRGVYPSARFLGIIAGGDFTAPARQLVQSRNIDLFYVPKDKVVAAFDAMGLKMDYPDDSPEERKQQLAEAFQARLTEERKRKIARKLRDLIGHASVTGYQSRVYACLAALPQEIRITARHSSAPRVFDSIAAATAFLERPEFDFARPSQSFLYEITYSDGSEFDREVATLTELRDLHEQVHRVARHVESLNV